MPTPAANCVPSSAARERDTLVRARPGFVGPATVVPAPPTSRRGATPSASVAGHGFEVARLVRYRPPQGCNRFSNTVDNYKDGTWGRKRRGCIVNVLHAFQKKSKFGASTPQPDVQLIGKRLKAVLARHGLSGR